MKKFLVIFFVVVVTIISFSAKALDLSNIINFPKIILKENIMTVFKDFFLIATEKLETLDLKKQ